MAWFRRSSGSMSGGNGGGGGRRGGGGDGMGEGGDGRGGGGGGGGGGRGNHDRDYGHGGQQLGSGESRRTALRRIAEETVQVMQEGLYSYKGVDHLLRQGIVDMVKRTEYFPPSSLTKEWSITGATDVDKNGPLNTHISILNISTLDAARLLHSTFHNIGGDDEVARSKIGILNFASATKPGGGFLTGAEAQEESIARSSTLSASLKKSDNARKFYRMHERESADNDAAFYSHGIIYSPDVVVFRDDEGGWTYPVNVDVLSCAAVNAGEALKHTGGAGALGMEVRIEKEMQERMGRILFVFEQHGVRNIVLGTFGTGVFQNKVAIVARIWAHLLLVADARFRTSFDRILFAITGEDTFAAFHSAFEAWGTAARQQPQSAQPQKHVLRMLT